jgi:hypothetical protein
MILAPATQRCGARAKSVGTSVPPTAVTGGDGGGFRPLPDDRHVVLDQEA